jgi:hypothetical protein
MYGDQPVTAISFSSSASDSRMIWRRTSVL